MYWWRAKCELVTVLKLAIMQLILSKSQLNYKEWARTLGLVTAGTVTTLKGQEEGSVVRTWRWKEVVWLGGESACQELRLSGDAASWDPIEREKNTWNSLSSFLPLISAGPSLLFEPREPESWLTQAVSWGTQHGGRRKQAGERSQQKLPIAPTKLVDGEQPKSTGIWWCFESWLCFLLNTCLWANSFFSLILFVHL